MDVLTPSEPLGLHRHQRIRLGARCIGHLCAGEHAGDFLAAFVALKADERGAHPALAVIILDDLPVMIGHGGDADDEGELTPRRIDAPDLDAPVVTVSAGERQTLFALADGAIRGCGMCEYGPRTDEVILSPAPLHTSLRVATSLPLRTALA